MLFLSYDNVVPIESEFARAVLTLCVTSLIVFFAMYYKNTLIDSVTKVFIGFNSVCKFYKPTIAKIWSTLFIMSMWASLLVRMYAIIRYQEITRMLRVLVICSTISVIAALVLLIVFLYVLLCFTLAIVFFFIWYYFESWPQHKSSCNRYATKTYSYAKPVLDFLRSWARYGLVTFINTSIIYVIVYSQWVPIDIAVSAWLIVLRDVMRFIKGV